MRTLLRLTLLLTSVLGSYACRTLPEREWEALEELKSELHLQQAPDYLPEAFADFMADFDRLRLQYRRTVVQGPLLGDRQGLQEQLTHHLTRGERLLAETRRTREILQERQGRELETIRMTLNSLSPTLHPDLRGQLTSVQIQLHQAGQFWQMQEFLLAEPLLDQARKSTEILVKDIDQLLARLEDPVSLDRWKNVAEEAIGWSRVNRKPAVIIDKYQRKILVYQNGRMAQQFPVELGWNGWADKLKAGDGATPEGRYQVLAKKGPGQTRYFRALLLDYPNEADRTRFRQAREDGKLEDSATIGGLIEIHGGGGRGDDWTQGCVALENASMKQLFELAYEGMPVAIVGRL